jgi:hypothetical protein
VFDVPKSAEVASIRLRGGPSSTGVTVDL